MPSRRVRSWYRPPCFLPGGLFTIDGFSEERSAKDCQTMMSSRPPMRRISGSRVKRSLLAAGAAGLVLTLAAPAPFAAAGVTGSARTQHAAAAAHADSGFPTMHGFKLPYTDPDQAGLLTLCNTKDQPITHGSIATMPFVWRAVSDVPTPKQLRVRGVTASLFAYQPRPYTPAGDWSGTALTAASLYRNLAHPMVQETPIDVPLTQMTESFPPIWDHLIELRLYLGAPDMSPDVIQYAAADLVINGSTWAMVEGGTAGCTSGTAVSREVLDHMKGASGTPTPAASTAAGGTGGGHASPQASAGSGAGSSASHSALAAAETGASNASDSSSVGGVVPGAIGVGVTVVVVLAASALWRGRRRGRRAGL